MAKLTAEEFVQTLRDAGVDLDIILARMLAGAMQSDRQLRNIGRVGGFIESDPGYDPSAKSDDDESGSEEESEDTDEAPEAESGGES